MSSASRSSGRAGKAPGQRPLRVGEEIRHALAELLSRGVSRDPDLADRSVTVTEVAMTPDLRLATVYYLPLAPQDRPIIAQALTRNARWLKGQIGHMVHLKYVPELRFQLDERFDKVSRLEKLIAEAPKPPLEPDAVEATAASAGQAEESE